MKEGGCPPGWRTGWSRNRIRALAIVVKLLAQVPWRSAHTWVVAAALIRGVALAPLASVPTARMGAPVVAPVVVVALTVSAICRDLIASSGLVSVSALLGFLFCGFL